MSTLLALLLIPVASAEPDRVAAQWTIAAPADAVIADSGETVAILGTGFTLLDLATWSTTAVAVCSSGGDPVGLAAGTATASDGTTSDSFWVGCGDGTIERIDVTDRSPALSSDVIEAATTAITSLEYDGAWLYVNETFARRLSRFRVAADGALWGRETVTTFGHGTYPDGLAFDAEGHVWITSIISNRVLRVGPDGAAQVVLEDADPAHVQWCEDAYLAGTLGRPHLDRAAGRVLKNISSLAFGGPDLRTAYLGCLLGDAIAYFRTPVAGSAPFHWTY